MKISEIKDMSVKELNDKISELKEEIFRLKWQKGINQLENPARIRNVRKDVAKMKTVLKEKNKK